MTTTIDTFDDADVRPAGDGPCTESEARDLLQRAAASAVEFMDSMQEILRRQAWVPLGYRDLREMLLEEFKSGNLINPKTGNSYSRAHVYRMANEALFRHEITTRTGVDASELSIAEKALRAARENHVDDKAMLDAIEKKVLSASDDGPPDVDTVQNIVDDVIGKASGRVPAPDRPAPSPEDYGRDSFSPDPESGPPDLRAGARVPARDDSDWSNSDPHRERRGSDPDGDLDPVDPFGEFGFQTPGSMAPDDGGRWDAALAEAEQYVDFTRALAESNKLDHMLPQILEVQQKLPGFLDTCADSELAKFDALLAEGEALAERIPAMLSAYREIRQCVADRVAEI